MMRREPGYVEIGVEVPPTVSVAAAELERSLATAVAELLADLGSPARPRLSVVTCAERQQGWEAPFRVSIGGEPCRINRERPASTWPHVVPEVLETILDNQVLLFTDDVLVTIVDACATSAPRQSALAACIDAVRMGLPASNMPTLLDMFEVGTPEESWIEEGLAAAVDTGIRVRAAPDTLSAFHALRSSDNEGLQATIHLTRLGIFFELGVIFGTVEFVPDTQLPAATYRFEWNGVRHPLIQGLAADHVLVNDTPKRVHDLLGLEAAPARNPANLSFGAAVARGDAEALCIAAGLTSWNACEHMCLALASFVRTHAAQFLTLTQVDRALSTLWQTQRQLVQATQSLFSTARLCRILRKLLSEQVSILDLGVILESLLTLYAQTDGEPTLEQAVDQVRDRLSPQIRHDLGIQSASPCVLLTEHLETQLVDRSLRDLPVDERHALVDAIGRCIATDDGARVGQEKVLVAGSAIRATVRALIEIEFPSVAVLAHSELLRGPNCDMQPITVVGST